MSSPAREGLDRLLATYPEAELAWAVHQHRTVLDARRSRTARRFAGTAGLFSESDGPWLCVDLYEPGGALLCFAIWITTGDVYELDEHGAVKDDPLIAGRGR